MLYFYYALIFRLLHVSISENYCRFFGHISMLIMRFTHWESCSPEEYSLSCQRFGYNCESSPEFLNFMMEHGAPVKFFSYKKKGELLGSVAVENGWLANDIKNKNSAVNYLPIPRCSVYLPFSDELSNKPILPFRAKCLHPLQNKLFLNTSYSLFNKRNVAISKDLHSGFSKKTISTREREIRKFYSSGGDFINVSEVDGSQLFDIYSDLYYARRSERIEMAGVNREFFIKHSSCFKGNLMMLNDEPVAIQLLVSVISHGKFFVDFINIGYRQAKNSHSLGTMIMWKNLTTLTEEAKEKGLDLFYSYGFMSGEYKTRWCNPHSTGRVLI